MSKVKSSVSSSLLSGSVGNGRGAGGVAEGGAWGRGGGTMGFSLLIECYTEKCVCNLKVRMISQNLSPHNHNAHYKHFTSSGLC